LHDHAGTTSVKVEAIDETLTEIHREVYASSTRHFDPVDSAAAVSGGARTCAGFGTSDGRR
jgi:hypothetical protein